MRNARLALLAIFVGMLGLLALPDVVQAQSAGQAAVPADSGEYLARAGNCVVCHSTPGGKPFAGGLKMATPMGAIYATNITPDKETGIGSYSLEEFSAAIRLGVAKDGHRLYPAMPYPSYAKMTDADVKALYDYFMTKVPAVKQTTPASEIAGWYGQRWQMRFWNWINLDTAAYKPKPDYDADWNRGAYLVQGLGHCGACHTPRDRIFAERALDETGSLFLSGALLDNWSAPNLAGDVNTGLGRWSEQDIAEFLKSGHSRWGTAFGTMIEVVNNSTQFLTDGDRTAIARYLKSLPPAVDQGQRPWVYSSTATEKLKKRDYSDRGAAIYARQCESCHVNDGGGRGMHLPSLGGNPAVLDPSAASLINVTLNGSSRLIVGGVPDQYRMPQFRLALKDQEVADVVTFIRQSWGNKASPVTAEEVAAMRKLTDPASDQIIVLRMR